MKLAESALLAFFGVESTCTHSLPAAFKRSSNFIPVCLLCSLILAVCVKWDFSLSLEKVPPLLWRLASWTSPDDYSHSTIFAGQSELSDVVAGNPAFKCLLGW